jgi:hypothetical protein
MDVVQNSNNRNDEMLQPQPARMASMTGAPG